MDFHADLLTIACGTLTGIPQAEGASASAGMLSGPTSDGSMAHQVSRMGPLLPSSHCKSSQGVLSAVSSACIGLVKSMRRMVQIDEENCIVTKAQWLATVV